MWAFLLAQLLKNWSISFFEKVTLLNLRHSTSPNWRGIPRWFPLFPTSPKVHPGLGQNLVGPLFGYVALLIAELFRKGDLLKIVVFLKENIGF